MKKVHNQSVLTNYSKLSVVSCESKMNFKVEIEYFLSNIICSNRRLY